MKHKLIDLLIACDEVRLMHEGMSDWDSVVGWYDADGAADCGEDAEDGAFLETAQEDRWLFNEKQEVDLRRHGRAVVWMREPGGPTVQRVLRLVRVVDLTDDDVGEASVTAPIPDCYPDTEDNYLKIDVKTSHTGVSTTELKGYWERADGSEGGELLFDKDDDGVLNLIDYDGGMALPMVVVEELRAAGFLVDEVFE
jgi:hypothetical protein